MESVAYDIYSPQNRRLNVRRKNDNRKAVQGYIVPNDI